MKKILLVGLGSLLFAEVYEACGISEDKARIELAKSIITTIKSTTNIKATSSKSFFGNSFFKDVSSSSKQSTNLTLSKVKIYKKGDQYCAKISDEELKELMNNKIKLILSYELSFLPTNRLDKQNKLKSLISDTKEAITLSKIYSVDINTIQKLEKKLKIFSDELEKNMVYSLKIIVKGNVRDIVIKIDGKKVKSKTLLKPGKHKYEIISSSHCPKTGVIELKKDTTITIDMSNYLLPALVVTANKNDASLKINGSSWPLGKKKVFQTCFKEKIPFEVRYEDQVEKDTFITSPGNYESKSYSFISKRYYQKMLDKARSYESGSAIEIGYVFKHISFDEKYEDYNNVNAGKINYLKFNKWFRYGGGIEYSEDKGSNIAEAYLYLALHIPTIGDSALHIGKVVFVPFVGGKLGLGRHEIYNENTKEAIHNFPSDDTDDETNFKRDYTIQSAVAGFDIAISKDFGLNFYAEKLFTMEKSFSYGISMSLKLGK